MMNRWIAATGAALALSFLTLPVPVPLGGGSFSGTLEAADAAACDKDAKPADLTFKMKDMNGKDVSFSAYKGKVVVLDFWATWCGPCKVEIPGFVELQTKYKDKGLQVLGFSVDDTEDKLKPFAAQYKMNYPVLVGKDRSDIQDAYGPLWGIPTTLVIGRDGKICKRHMGMATKEQFEKEIKALL